MESVQSGSQSIFVIAKKNYYLVGNHATVTTQTIHAKLFMRKKKIGRQLLLKTLTKCKWIDLVQQISSDKYFSYTQHFLITYNDYELFE